MGVLLLGELGGADASMIPLLSAGVGTRDPLKGVTALPPNTMTALPGVTGWIRNAVVIAVNPSKP